MSKEHDQDAVELGNLIDSYKERADQFVSRLEAVQDLNDMRSLAVDLLIAFEQVAAESASNFGRAADWREAHRSSIEDRRRVLYQAVERQHENLQ